MTNTGFDSGRILIQNFLLSGAIPSQADILQAAAGLGSDYVIVVSSNLEVDTGGAAISPGVETTSITVFQNQLR